MLGELCLSFFRADYGRRGRLSRDVNFHPGTEYPANAVPFGAVFDSYRDRAGSPLTPSNWMRMRADTKYSVLGAAGLEADGAKITCQFVWIGARMHVAGRTVELGAVLTVRFFTTEGGPMSPPIIMRHWGFTETDDARAYMLENLLGPETPSLRQRTAELVAEAIEVAKPVAEAYWAAHGQGD
jgi:hypothetical protein